MRTLVKNKMTKHPSRAMVQHLHLGDCTALAARIRLLYGRKAFSSYRDCSMMQVGEQIAPIAHHPQDASRGDILHRWRLWFRYGLATIPDAVHLAPLRGC